MTPGSFTQNGAVTGVTQHAQSAATNTDDDNPDEPEAVTCPYVKVGQVSFGIIGGYKPTSPDEH